MIPRLLKKWLMLDRGLSISRIVVVLIVRPVTGSGIALSLNWLHFSAKGL
jgi:hypothetical protein